MQYELTRSIRFFLEGDNVNKFFSVDFNKELEPHKIFADFEGEYINLLETFKNSVFYKSKTGTNKVRSRLEIKHPWLKQHAKEEYYKLEPNKHSPKKYTIKEAPFLSSYLQKWLKRNDMLAKEVKDAFSRSEDIQSRKSDIAFLVRQFLSADNFFFIHDFVIYSNDKDTNSRLDKLKEVASKMEVLSKQIIYLTAADQSRGIEIARASFNYYTINKISKNFDKDIEENQKKLREPYKKDLDEEDLLQKVGFIDFLENSKKSQDESQYNYITLSELSVENLYKALKDFKSQQKSAFLKIMQSISSAKEVEGVADKFPLFGGHDKKSKQQEVLREFFNLTREIQASSTQQNQQEQRNRKIKRGTYFQKSWGFKNYVDYCKKIFQPVAISYGKTKAEIRSIKQEKMEARLLKYWAHIIEKDGEFSLLLIPKKGNNLSDVRNYLSDIKSQEDSNVILYSFNSLTLRALNKLIRKNYPKKIPNLNKNPLPIYTKVLNGEYQKIVLDLAGFDERQIQKLVLQEYKNEEDFRMNLESVCYSLQKLYVSEENIEVLKGKYKAQHFRITSYDLERLPPNKKEHTLLWENFWKHENEQQNYPIRLNPEIRIFHRQKQKDQPANKQKNRFSRAHKTVAFTFTQNAAQTRMEVAFAKEKDLLRMITKFNEEVISKFVKEKGNNLYYYGIDRGTQELATLCVVNFSEEKYQVTLKDGSKKYFQKPIFPKIKTYRINDASLHKTKEIIIDSTGKTKEVTVIDNPSYFITDTEIFNEEYSSCFDLTTAKLINGKLVLNGDVKTYLALKKANAKRKLFDVLSKIDQQANVEFDEDKKAFIIKFKKKEHKEYQILCYYSRQQERVLSRKCMQEKLQKYLNSLRSDKSTEIITIERINNLRDAITSNMVGIIAYLYEKYPGIINLENLSHTGDIDRHFRSNNESIERRLELSLYKKFQKSGLVPPRLKQTIFLRENENFKVTQLGIIHFIPKEGTSSRCPFCGESIPMESREKDKFREHRYVCYENQSNCGFDTDKPKKLLEYIRNADDVAAYNIAKEKLSPN